LCSWISQVDIAFFLVFTNLDYSRVKNAVRSGDDAACEGVLK